MTKKSAAPLQRHYQLESYRILDVLSYGGFSIVYLAQSTINQQLVAIKEYLPETLVRRHKKAKKITILSDTKKIFLYGMHCFFEEGRALFNVKHNNIVQVIDFFKSNNTAYLVLAYEAGRTLHDYVEHYKKNSAIREHFLKHMTISLLNGLRQIHTSKLLHLDIKPSNIYIRKDASPVLIDFGSSRQVLHEEMPETIIPMYTPGYAAPEQSTGNGHMGPWTDIYGIGATLYSCLGRCLLPHAEERLKHDTLTPAVDRFHGLYADEFLRLIDHCLALDPLQRPQTGYELQKRLGAEYSLFYQNIPTYYNELHIDNSSNTHDWENTHNATLAL